MTFVFIKALRFRYDTGAQRYVILIRQRVSLIEPKQSAIQTCRDSGNVEGDAEL